MFFCLFEDNVNFSSALNMRAGNVRQSHTNAGNNVTDSMVQVLPATVISSCFFSSLLLLFLFVVDELSGIDCDGGILELADVFLVFFFP